MGLINNDSEAQDLLYGPMLVTDGPPVMPDVVVGGKQEWLNLAKTIP